MLGLRNYETGLYKQLEDLNKKLDKLFTENRNQSLTIYELNSTIKRLQKDLKKSEEKNQKLILEIERLKNNNKKDSSNSNKPSSTNGYKKVKLNNREKSNRKQGGQLNHKGVTLTKEDIDIMIKNGEIDEVIEVVENKNEFNKNYKPVIIYEYDIQIKKIVIKRITYPNKPTNVLRSPVYYGNYIKTFCSLLGMKYMSMDGIKSFISSITNNKINLSKGTIYSWKEMIAEKLSESEYKKIKEELLNSLVLHVDETPIKINGEQYYIHNISNGTHTLQYVNKKRGEDAIKEFGFLDKYQGILVHDHFLMYYSYGTNNAECNVHITKYLNGVIDFTTHVWAKQMKELLLEAKAKKESFIIEHKDEMSAEVYEEFKEKEYASFKERYLDLIRLGRSEYKKDYKTNSYREEELKLLNRMEKYANNHLLFLEKFYVPYSNNRAESDVRHAKIIQKIGKFRSIDGAENYVVTRSCYSTYQKNKKDVFDSLLSLLNGTPVLV